MGNVFEFLLKNQNAWKQTAMMNGSHQAIKCVFFSAWFSVENQHEEGAANSQQPQKREKKTSLLSFDHQAEVKHNAANLGQSFRRPQIADATGHRVSSASEEFKLIGS